MFDASRRCGGADDSSDAVDRSGNRRVIDPTGFESFASRWSECADQRWTDRGRRWGWWRDLPTTRIAEDESVSPVRVAADIEFTKVMESEWKAALGLTDDGSDGLADDAGDGHDEL